MASAKSDGGPDPAARAARALERKATALGISVARSLYGRWRRLPPEQRARIERLADTVRSANEQLAMVETAKADPEVSELEVRDLRADLARELALLASADVKASRGAGRRAM
jgi:acyl-CoA reductase-like NAD-dependent aldehyde dehydrogenase